MSFCNYNLFFFLFLTRPFSFSFPIEIQNLEGWIFLFTKYFHNFQITFFNKHLEMPWIFSNPMLWTRNFEITAKISFKEIIFPQKLTLHRFPFSLRHFFKSNGWNKICNWSLCRIKERLWLVNYYIIVSWECHQMEWYSF